MDVPYLDPFLHPVNSRLWISDQWLSDLLTSSVFDNLSWRGVYLFYSLIFFISFYLLIQRDEEKINLPAICIALGLGIRLSAIHFILRPVLFSIFFFSLFLILLRKRKYAWLPVVFIVWANMHPSFAFSLGIFGLYILTKDRSPQCFLALFMSIMGTLFNPYGFALHESIFSLAGSDYFMNLNQEWRRIALGSDEFLISLGIVGFIVISFIAERRFKERLFEVAGILLLFFSLFHSIRFLPYFSIFMILPLAEYLSSLLKKISPQFLIIDIPKPVVLRSGLILMFFLFLFCSYNYAHGPSDGLHPYECTIVLKNIKSSGKDPVVLASPNHGGYLIFNGLKPIIDDRNTLLGEEFYRKYFDNVKAQPEIFEYMEGMNVTHAVFSTNSGLAEYVLQDNRYEELECKGGKFRLIGARLVH